MQCGAGMLAGSLVACVPALAQPADALLGAPASEPASSLWLNATAPSVPARAAFSIEALHEPVDVAMNFTLSEIGHWAEQTGWTGNHAPLGFSIAKTGYRVIVEVSIESETTCSEPIKASIQVMLTDRHIEIAKGLSLMLSRLTLPNLQHDGALADEDRVRMEQVIRAAMDWVWPSLQIAMRAAANGVESADEITSLGQACLPADGVVLNSQSGTRL